jgi:hypothetical protein
MKVAPAVRRNVVRREVRPWWLRCCDVALAVGAVVLVTWGIDAVLSFFWTPRTVALDDGEVLYYPWSAVWIIAGIGAALVVAGLRLGLDRQFYNWLFVSIGTGVLVLGTTYAARERVVITAEEFAVRRWWGLQSHAWRYDDLDSVTVVLHNRRKEFRWVTVRVESKSGKREEVGVPRLIESAQLKLQTHARAKGVRVGWGMDSRG